MNHPNKFTIKKPRITLSEEQKNQARVGMAGEAVKASLEATASAPADPQPELPTIFQDMPSLTVENVEQPVGAIVPTTLPIEPINLPTPEVLAADLAEVPNVRQGRGSRGKKIEKVKDPDPEDSESETQHVRMSKDTVLKAKMNILLLPRNSGIKNLRDYGDAAFAFYEAHLRKTGKLPNY